LKSAVHRPVRRQVEGMSEIEWMHPESGHGSARPAWIRRFIRGVSRGCKVREDRDPIIDPAVDAGFRETWRRRDGGAGGCENRGDSGIHQPTPRERETGATRKIKPEAKPEDEARGETHKRHREAQPGGAEFEGNRELKHRRHRRTRDSG